MRKITKEAENCSECGRPTTAPKWEDFCDNCGKELGPWNQKHGYMTTRIFPEIYEFSRVEKVEVCSWACFFDWLGKNKEKVLKAGHMDIPTINKDNAEEFFNMLYGVVQNVQP